MLKKPNLLGFAWTQDWQQTSFTYNLFLKLPRLAHPVLPNNPPYFGYFAKPGQDKNTVYFTDYAAVPWNDWLASRWEKAQDTLTQAAAFSHDKGYPRAVCLCAHKIPCAPAIPDLSSRKSLRYMERLANG